MTTLHRSIVTIALLAGAALARPAAAHCDTTRGPVVTDARKALEARDPKLVLHWVRPEDEAAVRKAFEETLKVRALSPEAKALADRSFFETLVRIHRAGEGAPFTGLTDAEPEPIIAAADQALERGSSEALEGQLVGAVKSGLAERFSAARAAKDFRPGDVAAGRAFVEAYVAYTHWVEGVLTAAQGPGGHEGAGEAEHQAALHVVAREPGDGAAIGTTSTRHGPGALPWLLTGLVSTAALVEAAFLLRRRPRPA